MSKIKKALILFDYSSFSSGHVWENFYKIIKNKEKKISCISYLFSNSMEKVNLEILNDSQKNCTFRPLKETITQEITKTLKFQNCLTLLSDKDVIEKIILCTKFLSQDPKRNKNLLFSLISYIFLKSRGENPHFHIPSRGTTLKFGSGINLIINEEENDECPLKGHKGFFLGHLAELHDLDHIFIFGKDPGLYTSDAHIIPQSRLIKKLSYEEAKEIPLLTTSYISPSSLSKIQKLGIQLQFGCMDPLTEKGTLIFKKEAHCGPVIKVIAVKYNVTVISITNGDMWRTSGFLIDIFKCFHDQELSLDLISTSETNITLSLDPNPEKPIEEIKSSLLTKLSAYGSVRILEGLSTVSLIGHNIRSLLPKISPIFKVFENQKIYLMSQAANDINLSFIIAPHWALKCQKELHEILFSENKKNPLFGSSWQEIHEGTAKQSSTEKTPWWSDFQKELLHLSHKETPQYIYSEKALIKNTHNLLDLNIFDKIYYAMKANHHPEILKSLFNEGIYFETVSIGEINHLKKYLPQLKTKDILFTPNFISKDEFILALKEDVTVTLDNIYPLKQWPEIFKKKSIIIRLDPGQGKGHHDFVRTAGEQSKFGILPKEIPEIVKLSKKHQIKIIGLHAHAGSGIQQSFHWKEIGFFLCKLAKNLPDIEIINIGGGLGVANKPGDPELNLINLKNYLTPLKKQFPNYKIWLEPGRYLVSNAGVLLTKVTQLKRKGHTHYLGIDAGMNTLLRPSLYGAYHHILNLSKLDQESTEIINIVGPICETGDCMGVARIFPKSEENDVLLIENAGAYGKVMSSRYNLRKEVREYFIPLEKSI
jgi:diaminopimelate decarboxylase/aspartate kinase